MYALDSFSALVGGVDIRILWLQECNFNITLIFSWSLQRRNKRLRQKKTTTRTVQEPLNKLIVPFVLATDHYCKEARSVSRHICTLLHCPDNVRYHLYNHLGSRFLRWKTSLCTCFSQTLACILPGCLAPTTWRRQHCPYTSHIEGWYDKLRMSNLVFCTSHLCGIRVTWASVKINSVLCNKEWTTEQSSTNYYAALRFGSTKQLCNQTQREAPSIANMLLTTWWIQNNRVNGSNNKTNNMVSAAFNVVHNWHAHNRPHIHSSKRQSSTVCVKTLAGQYVPRHPTAFFGHSDICTPLC